MALFFLSESGVIDSKKKDNVKTIEASRLQGNSNLKVLVIDLWSVLELAFIGLLKLASWF